MEILYLLIAISFSMALVGLGSFLWANHTGQFVDMKGPAEKILFEDQHPKQ